MKQIFYNGDILTMDDAQPGVEAVVVEDGKIVETGRYEDLISAHDAYETINLEGKCLMPAFIDAHSHFMALANGLGQVDLSRCTNFREIQDAIRTFIANHQIPPGVWVKGRDFDPSLLKEQTHPTKEILDKVSAQNPVSISHKNSHVGVFNSLALARVGITEDTKDPDGGVIERKNGRITGYLEESAFIENIKKAPMEDLDVLLGYFSKAQDVYLSHGITTAQDGMLVSLMAPLYDAFLQTNRLHIDLVLYADYKEAQTLLNHYQHCTMRYRNHCKLGGIKIFLDGSPQSRTAFMKTPYANESSYQGYPTMSEDEVIEAVRFACQHRLQILAHANGDAACLLFIEAVETVAKEYPVIKHLRPVMIHAQFLDAQDIKRAAKAGIIASFFVAHVYHWGDVHCENVGIKRAATISPAATALKNGLLFTFHQDSPVIMPDMLETVWASVQRSTKQGRVLGKEERIGVYDALKAVTINAAYAYFEEETKGSIHAGKQADFVVLDQNPLKVPVDDLRHISVWQTYKNGRLLYQAPGQDKKGNFKAY